MTVQDLTGSNEQQLDDFDRTQEIKEEKSQPF